jgi:hypothetical protein
MNDFGTNTPLGIPESSVTTVTYVGISNAPIRDPNACSVMSYTLPSENTEPSRPLSEGAVRVGNSLLSARVPESAILRAGPEDF